MFHEMMNTKYCILLKDGSHIYGFHPESGCVDVTYSNALALPFNSTTAAMRFVDKYGKPGNGLAAHLIQGFRPITETSMISC